MAQRTNDRRTERRTKSETNMNRAVILLIGGLVAEWYLLMADRYYARGTVDQVLSWYNFFGVMRWAALAAAAAGVVLGKLRGQKPWVSKLGWGLAAVGLFFSLSSFAMRRYYPISVTVLCVLVPVLMILGIIYLFYQAEFSVQATALAMALGALVLLNRSQSASVRLCATAALMGIASLFGATLYFSRKDGAITHKGRVIRVFDARTDFKRVLAVLALCFLMTLMALGAPSVAFFATWGLGIITFVLAVYYTIKLM